MTMGITVDGSRWEFKQPKLGGWGATFLYARPYGSKGKFSWKVAWEHIVATREEDD